MWLKTEDGSVYNISQALAVRIEKSEIAENRYEVTLHDCLPSHSPSHSRVGLPLTRRPLDDESARRLTQRIYEGLIAHAPSFDMADAIKLTLDELQAERQAPGPQAGGSDADGAGDDSAGSEQSP